MTDLADDERRLTLMMLDDVAGAAFVALVAKRLAEKEGVGEVGKDDRLALTAEAIVETAQGLFPGLDPERLRSWVWTAKGAWQMDSLSSVQTEPLTKQRAN